ncbi:MAG: Eco57I restriction-modification methylase domain-containing protein, partial [Muribaculaceae bacterium]|nr:Eco57I restriction-modification methylase domain-containing protein [Muribaculaceae bacterium]
MRNLVKKFINQNWGEFDAAIVVFDDNKDWRLSFVCDIKEEATAPKRFTFVFGEKDNFYRTAIDRFDYLQTHGASFENIRKAFSVDALSDDFFDEYRELYADFVEYITGKRYVKESNKWVERVIDKPNYQYESTFGKDDKLVRDYIKKMFGRIVFLYFLQRKGWLDGNRQYMHDLFYNSDKKDNFLDGVLEPLFFEVLNTDKPYRTNAAKALPGSENIPYLNGGLFAHDEIDERTCIFKEEDFERLFAFLDSYNFTIDENDTDDAEIGIDPEMLGRIFENLLEDNKDKGAFYTPKEIVDYMCRESIIAYLQNGIPERSHELIRNFVETFDTSQLDEKQKLFIRKKLQAVKICDPAIGSGAFPMGLVNLLSKLYVAMKSDTDTAKMKRHIMEQNIYGVDIEKGAVDIARLRFWLAMIVEEKNPIPLPNLHFKIMQGNSLLESYNGIDLSDLTKLSGQSSLFDSENSEREALISSLKSYYKTSDHTLRDRLFNDIINNVRRQLLDKNITLPAGKDPSANTDFFLWHTWFSDVFANGGFDIVIGNPPYGLINKKQNKSDSIKVPDNILQEYKNLPQYKSAQGGMLNIFRLFIVLSVNILNKGGVFSEIFPLAFAGDLSVKKLRSFIYTNCELISFDAFPERDNPNKRVFASAKMSVCIMNLYKRQNENTSFILRINTDRFVDKSCSYSLMSYKDIILLNQSTLAIPLVTDSIFILLRKIFKQCIRLKDIAKCSEGEIHMTFCKPAFSKDNFNPILLRGANFDRFILRDKISQGEVFYIDEEILNSIKPTAQNYRHTKRIVMQGITGVNEKTRLKVTIVENKYLANSANFLSWNAEVDLYYFVGLLNSKLLNFIFKQFSTNSNVNG